MTKKITIEHMQKLAKANNGQCLSLSYLGSAIPLLWECKEGHQWFARPQNVRYGTWCKICKNRDAGINKTRSISDVAKLAIKFEGQLLSKVYKEPHKKLLWKCKNSHEFKASSASVQQGHWCPECSGNKKIKLKEVRNLAIANNGKLLSKKYINAHSKLKWQCKNKHLFESSYANVYSRKWCPECAGHIKLSIDVFKKIANERGGKLISNKYINIDTKLKWQCINGHYFNLSGYDAKKGRWCPSCSSSLGERICRCFFEQIFKNKFPKSKPIWLRNPQNSNLLELDGYCKRLNIAFEHHGSYHYEIDGIYSKTNKELQHRIDTDKIKMNLCEKNKVKLFVIPEIYGMIEVDDIKSVIEKEAEQLKVELPSNFLDLEINLNEAYRVDIIDELQLIAKKRKGKLLSKKYIKSTEQLLWQCNKGHKWNANSNNIRRGRWCPKCAGNIKKDIEYINSSLINRNIKCLSSKYINANTKLEWLCPCGNKWFAIPDSVIRRKTGCPICSKKD